MDYLREFASDRTRVVIASGVAVILLTYMIFGSGPAQAPQPTTTPPMSADPVAESWGMPGQSGEFWLDHPEQYAAAQQIDQGAVYEEWAPPEDGE